MAKLLSGNSIDAYNDQRRSALFCACEFNHLAAAAKLVELGAKVEKCDTMGNTPLIIAVTKNFPQVAAMLLDNHAGISSVIFFLLFYFVLFSSLLFVLFFIF